MEPRILVGPNRWRTNEIPPGSSMISWKSTNGLHSDDMPIFCSFFTNMFYLREAWSLVRSCLRFDLDYVVEQVQDFKSWGLANNHKPTFLQSVARRYPNRALVWVDADAQIRSFPVLFHNIQENIGYHTWEGTPAGGTIYLSAIQNRREEILKQWRADCDSRDGSPPKHGASWDQVFLKTYEDEHFELPVEYCWIFDQRVKYPGKRIIDDPIDSFPVIEHMQASRWVN